MSSRSPQQGFAIALLLWMIAGMSLMVAAVIHFARADIAMAELRLDEARAQALGRGAALLAVRDKAMASQQATLDPAVGERSQAPGEGNERFKKTYDFGGDWRTRVHLGPAAGLVSLNNASDIELSLLFKHVGKASETDAADLAAAVLTYREAFPGFRYPEELLAIEGASRDVYDRVRGVIHPYRTGALSLADLPPEIRESLGDLLEEEIASSEGAGVPGRAAEGRLTFDLIAERKRNPGGTADRRIQVAEVSTVSASGHTLKQKIWLSSDNAGAIMRADAPGRVSSDRVQR